MSTSTSSCCMRAVHVLAMTLIHPHLVQNYFPSPSNASATSCQPDAESQAADVDVPCSGNNEGDQASESGKRQRSLEGEDGDEDAKRRVVTSGVPVTGTDNTMSADEHTGERNDGERGVKTPADADAWTIDPSKAVEDFLTGEAWGAWIKYLVSYSDPTTRKP